MSSTNQDSNKSQGLSMMGSPSDPNTSQPQDDQKSPDIPENPT